VPLTHIEVRRGSALRLRIAIADDALAEASDELGSLLRKLAPGTVTRAIATASQDTEIAADEIVVGSEHDGDDDAYHAGLRDRLSELFSSLCDTGLDDALDIVRQERARRAEVN
jgi:hypothetical protein